MGKENSEEQNNAFFDSMADPPLPPRVSHCYLKPLSQVLASQRVVQGTNLNNEEHVLCIVWGLATDLTWFLSHIFPLPPALPNTSWLALRIWPRAKLGRGSFCWKLDRLRWSRSTPLWVTSEASALVLAISVTVVGLPLTAASVEMGRRKGLVDLWCYSSMLY